MEIVTEIRGAEFEELDDAVLEAVAAGGGKPPRDSSRKRASNGEKYHDPALWRAR